VGKTHHCHFGNGLRALNFGSSTLSKKEITDQDQNPDTRSDSDRIQPTTAATDLSVCKRDFPASVGSEFDVFCGSDGNAYLKIPGQTTVYRLGGKPANHFLRVCATERGIRLKHNDLRDINEELTAHAEISGDVRHVWFRVAQVPGGIEIDNGDSSDTRTRVTADKVEKIENGSETLFFRPPTMRPLPKPAETGDLRLLDKYLNLDPASIVLLKGWISYTLAHAKVSTTSFPILVLNGDQGSGKTFLCRIIQALIDPSVVGVQTFPQNVKDLGIAAEHSHALFYDNLRNIRPSMSDKLCTAATGGATTTRQLYTNTEQSVLWLHVALVLNGIHAFLDQPDLAERALPMTLQPIDENKRRSESEITQDFETDLPAIFRGILDIISKILKYLPTIEITNPERMIDFSRWLAAMEKVDGVPPGVYQAAYSGALSGAMLDGLQENPLAGAVLSFVAEDVSDFWSGTPTDLLEKLNLRCGRRVQYSRDWPQNVIALSKRLRLLQPALKRQKIDVELGRRHKREIIIQRMEGYTDE
jgi:hypothetical protein